MAEDYPPGNKRPRIEYSPPTGGSSYGVMTEEKLQCSTCHNVITVNNPQSWSKVDYFYCPFCKNTFSKKRELQMTPALRDGTDYFKKKSALEQPEVLCDACTGEKQKAVKSCLDCCGSFCASHLEPHQVVPNYKNHKLINAVENLEKYICQKHGKPLELFCRSDKKFVCQFCTEGDHKNHKVTPLEEESGQRKSQLGKTQKELRQIIQEREKKIQEIHHSVNLSKKNTEKEKSDSVEVFTSLIRSIERSQAELLQVMEEKQKAAETQAEGLIKELQQEITDLKTRYTELEQLSHTDDHLHFLQSYISMCCAPDTRIRTEIRINIEVNVAFLRMTLSKFQQTLNEKLEETVSRELKRNKQYAVDVSLDPDTAHPNIILSDDGKHVTYADTKQNLSGMQKRFTNYPMILGKHGFSSGRFYYEVQVSGKTMWDLGVVRESVKNKGRFKAFKPHNGYWTLILRKGNEYNARDESLIPLFLSKKPQKIGVFVDYEEGLVSFYDVETSSHIYSFTGQSYTEKLYPFFSPRSNGGGKNSAPMIISHV